MIKAEHFIIRPLEENDIEVLYQIHSQDLRGEYQECQFESKVQLQKQFEKDGICSEQYQSLFIEDLNGELIGTISLNFIRSGLVRIGVVLAQEKRNANLGKEITKTITEYLFNNYPLVRIEAETDIENIAAQKVLEYAGFQKEGVLKSFRYHHGKYHDSVMYSNIRSV